MSVTVEATYENGTLKLTEPLPLKDHQKVQVTVTQLASVAEQTYGLMGWDGGDAALERIALDPALDPQKSA